ncbi:MAG: hydroxyacid-oxoacid transhydrogenase [Halanaeroarchaeum sp.]
MSYDRSVSAPEHDMEPETVWNLQMPAIRFGRGAVRELPYQLDQIGVVSAGRGLLVTDQTLESLGHAGRVIDHLDDAGYTVDVWAQAEREPSVSTVAACVEFARDSAGPEGYDFYLGLGGGSCMDIVKATRVVIANGGDPIEYIARPTGEGKSIRESGPPLVLMPTTAGTGAEISPVAILAVEDENIKEGISSPTVRADAAVLDPTFTTTLPPDLTAETAMDALGHAMEGYTTHRYDELLRASDPAERPVYAGRTEFTEAMSERAIKLIAGNVRAVVSNGDDIDARASMLRGALFGAIAGLTAGASLCHAIAYPVGNRYHTYHGETIAVLTPATTLGYNVPSNPARFARLAELLGAQTDGLGDRAAADRAHEAYCRLQEDLGVLPSGLGELADVSAADREWLATQTIETQERLLRCNPRPVTAADVETILEDALQNWGAPPE